MLLSYRLIKSTGSDFCLWQTEYYQVYNSLEFQPNIGGMRATDSPVHQMEHAVCHKHGKKSPMSKRIKKVYADSPKIVIQVRGTFLFD